MGPKAITLSPILFVTLPALSLNTLSRKLFLTFLALSLTLNTLSGILF